MYLFQWKEFGLTLASQQVCILISDYFQQTHWDEQLLFYCITLGLRCRGEGMCYLQFSPCHQAYILGTMFCASTIGCAIDFTFQFNWLRDGYTLDHNSTDIRFSDQVNMTYLTAGQLG